MSEDRAYHDGYIEGHQDGFHEGKQQGWAQGYDRAWRDAQKVANGWAWVEKLPHLHETPQVPR